MEVINNCEDKTRDSGATREIIRKPYSKPNLEKLGDLRALTLGGSPGSGDSGGGIGVEKLPVAGMPPPPTPIFSP